MQATLHAGVVMNIVRARRSCLLKNNEFRKVVDKFLDNYAESGVIEWIKN